MQTGIQIQHLLKLNNGHIADKKPLKTFKYNTC